MDERAKLRTGHRGEGNLPEDELLASYRYLVSILESMLEVVVVANPDGTIRTVNRAALELLGYAEEELIGQPVGTIFEEEEEEEEEEFFKGSGLAQLVHEGAVRDVELTLVARSGEQIPVIFNGSVIREEDGRLACVVGVARDMRARKQAEEELKAAHRKLEEQVEKMERFFQITMGREKRILELKREVKELKKKLEAVEGELKQGEEGVV